MALVIHQLISAPGWHAIFGSPDGTHGWTAREKLPLVFWALIASGDGLAPVGMVTAGNGKIYPANDVSDFVCYEHGN